MISEKKRAANRANSVKATAAAAAKAASTQIEYEASPARCVQCGQSLPYLRRREKFCTRSCSAKHRNTGRTRTEVERRKIGDSLLGRLNATRVIKACSYCSVEFEATSLNGRRYCSPKCGRAATADALRGTHVEAPASHLAYLSGERTPLAALNKLFDTSFKKERVGGRFFDFADEKYLIEHTRDFGKGIGSATSRFAAAKSDTRTKILYANMKHLGPRRRARLEALGVTIRDYRELGD